MTSIPLPPRSDLQSAPTLNSSRQLTIIGANGAGKSRFMREMMSRCGNRAYFLSALGASFPERQINEMPGSIDMLYEEAVVNQPYLQPYAVSELDKLGFLLFSDELRYLLNAKALRLSTGKPAVMHETKLDKVIKLWEQIFPSNKLLRHGGTWQFATESGSVPADIDSLSQGEKVVLYYIAAVLYAMPHAVIFVESPTLFLHPAMINTLWNSIEGLRPDCTFVYNTVDMDFVLSRTGNECIWVKSYDVDNHTWDYELIDRNRISDELFIELMGSRNPVLFIEGDAVHSIDARLYTLVFSDYTVRPLGSCNKVIESTRTFNDLRPMHHLESIGIVDRDRRTDIEVGYLRRKGIMVPDVAEVENIFLLEKVIKTMARMRGKDPEKVFSKVRRSVVTTFAANINEQALQHVRHQVKRDVECKIDAKFSCITAMEAHLRKLIFMLQPRERYEEMVSQFTAMVKQDDYDGILRVFNHKPMLAASHVHELLGYKSPEAYIRGVLDALKEGSRDAAHLRASIKWCFGIKANEEPPSPEPSKLDTMTAPPPQTADRKKQRHRHNTDTTDYGRLKKQHTRRGETKRKKRRDKWRDY